MLKRIALAGLSLCAILNTVGTGQEEAKKRGPYTELMQHQGEIWDEFSLVPIKNIPFNVMASFIEEDCHLNKKHEFFSSPVLTYQFLPVEEMGEDNLKAQRLAEKGKLATGKIIWKDHIDRLAPEQWRNEEFTVTFNPQEKYGRDTVSALKIENRIGKRRFIRVTLYDFDEDDWIDEIDLNGREISLYEERFVEVVPGYLHSKPNKLRKEITEDYRRILDHLQARHFCNDKDCQFYKEE